MTNISYEHPTAKATYTEAQDYLRALNRRMIDDPDSVTVEDLMQAESFAIRFLESPPHCCPW